MGKRFEQRFEGKSNAGLRKAIREAVSGHATGMTRMNAVLSLGRTVALTASGQATLEEVASDYFQAAEAAARRETALRCNAGNSDRWAAPKEVV